MKTTEHRFAQKKRTWDMLFKIKLTDKLLKDLFSKRISFASLGANVARIIDPHCVIFN